MTKKHWTKLILLLLALGIVLAMVLYETASRARIFLGATLVEPQEWEQLKAECASEAEFDPSVLRWQGEKVPFDAASKTIYIPQSLEADSWSGRLTASSGTLYILKNGRMQNKAECIAGSQRFQVALVSNGVWSQAELTATGMAAVCIWGEDDDTLADFLVIDPDRKEGRAEITSTFCTFHVRGNSTGAAADPGYRVSLCNKDGEQVKKNLMGIRDDDDWILNGFAFDSLMVREKLAYHLWEKANALETKPVYSSNVTYVELFLNNEYRGAYGLMPRLDKKQMKLGSQDIVYKIREHGYLSDQEYADGLGQNSLRHGLVTIEYPDVGGTWDYLQAYQKFVQGQDDMLKQVNAEIPLSNCVASNLFLSLTQAVDNRWKNLILIAKYENDSYQLYRTMWDVDLTFGNTWKESEGFCFDPTPSPIGNVCDVAYLAMAEKEPENMMRLCREKWQDWKNAGITAEYLCAYVDVQMEKLVSSGAMWRTAQRRPRVEYVTDAAPLRDWIRKQFIQMDAYYS